MFKMKATTINNLVNFNTGSQFSPTNLKQPSPRDQFGTIEREDVSATKLTLNQVSGLALGNQTETILEYESQVGELKMYSRKFTTKNFIYQVGEKLSQIRDIISTRWFKFMKQIAVFTPKAVVSLSQSACSVKQLPHIATTAPTIGEKFMHCSKIGLIHQATKGVKNMAHGLVALSKTIARVAAINNIAIAQTVKVVLMAGVIIGIGAVVVPVSEAQAQAEFRFSNAQANTLVRSTREAPSEMAERVVDFTFAAYSGVNGQDYPLVVEINTNTTTAEEGKDFILPETPKLVGSNVGALTAYRVRIPSDDIDENNGEVVDLRLRFADPNSAKFRITEVGILTDQINFSITIEDGRSSVPPLVATNYESNALDVSKDIGDSESFYLEFELENAAGESTVSGKNITISHTPLNSSNFTIDTSQATIAPGNTTGRIKITKVAGATINVNETITLNFTLTNAYFSYTCAHTPCRESRANDGTISLEAGTTKANTETLTITFVDKPSVTVETIASEVAQSDFVEFVVNVDPATHQDPLTVQFTESGSAGRVNTVTSVDIPVGQSQATHKQTFSGVGNYRVVLATTGADAGEFVLLPGSEKIDVNVVADTTLPTIALGTAPTVSAGTSSFNFALTSTGGIHDDNISINYIITETGSTTGYLTSPTADTVHTATIGNGRSADVPITLDRISTNLSGNGEVTITLLPGAEYKLNSTSAVTQAVTIPEHNTGTVLPELTIASDYAGSTGYGVTEGYSFSYTVTASDAITEDITITPTLDSASVTAGATLNPTSITLSSTDKTATGVVNLGSSFDAPATSQITLTLPADASKYTLSTSEIVVTVKDNDNATGASPVVTIMSWLNTDVKEGSDIGVRLRARPAFTTETTVRLDLSETLGSGETFRYLNENQSLYEVTFPAGDGNPLIRFIPIRPTNSTNEPAGSINVSLAEASGYTLPNDPTGHSGEFREFDVAVTNTPVPALTISSEYTTIRNDFIFPYSVTTTESSVDVGSVGVRLFDSRNMVVNATVNLPQLFDGVEKASATVTELTAGNTPPGVYTLKIDPHVSGPLYTIANPDGITITIVNQNTTPSISLMRNQEKVNEGSSASFTATASATTNVDLKVDLNVKDFVGRTSEYIDEATISERLAAGQTVITFEVPTKTSSGSGLDGVLEAQVVSRLGYTAPEATAVEYVYVEDQDAPDPSTVSVTASLTSIVEGENAVFTFSRGADNTGELKIGYVITETDDVSASATGDTGFAIIADGDSDVDVIIGTVQDQVTITADSGLTLRIQRLEEYQTGTSPSAYEGNYRIGTDNSATVAVTDQIVPSVSITAPEYAVEGVPFTFTIGTTQAPTGNDSYVVSYTVGNGVVNGSTHEYYKDHTPAGGTLTTNTSGTVTINTTTPSHQITVNTNTDLASTEADGQIDIQITGGGSNYKPASETATNVTIQDEDRIPKVSIDLTSAATMEEGETAIFDLTTKTPITTTDIMVNVNVVQSTGGGDFIDSRDANPGPVQLLSLGNKGTLMIRTVADTEDESSATITATVAAATAESNGKINYLVADSNFSDFVTVQDNDIDGANIASITISGPDQIYEGSDAEYTFTTDMAPAGNDVINVNYRITEFGAFLETSAAGDGITGEIQFEATETTQSIKLPTFADALDEGDGWVRVQVLAYTSGGTGLQYSVGADAIKQTILLDDDDDSLPNVTIAAVSDSIIEGDVNHANFTISSTGGTSTAARVDLLIQQEGDFISSTVVNDSSKFPEDDISVPRDSSATFQVELFNDGDEETNGSVTVSIIRDTSDNPVYSLGATTSARTTIIDNDAGVGAGGVKITIADDSEEEGNLESENKTLEFNVTLSRAALNDISVDYMIMDVTTMVNDDYTDITMRETEPMVFVPAAGKLIFKAGQTSKTITIDVVEDDVYENMGNPETFTITLSSATQGAVIMDNEATGTITDMDVEQQFPDVTIDDITVSEYAGETGITATLSKVHNRPVTMAFNHLPRSSTGATATNGEDYTFRNELIVIPAGKTIGTKTFSVINDADNPAVNEFFKLDVTLDGARFGGNNRRKEITVTITERPDITISTDFTEVADSDYFEYTVDINPATHTNPVMVNLMADDSFPLTLTNDSDSSSIMIPANKSSATGRIEFSDTYASGVTAREFVLIIAAANSNEYTANPIKDEISVDIADGRTLPVVSNSTTASSVIEGGMFDVEVVIAPAQTKDIDLNFELSTGAESPFVATLAGNPNQLTIPANDPTESWPVTIAENNQRDNHGEVSFKILPGVGYKINPLQFATTTQIVDNDITDTIEFTKFTISEDGVTPTGQEIKLADTGRSGQDIVVNYEILTGRSTATRHTAETDGDYMVDALMGAFTFNQTTSTDRIVITGRSDTSYEGNETIIVRFTSTNGVFLNDQGEKVATIDVTYIIDDSIADPVFTVSNLEFPVSTLSIQDSPPTAHTISFDFATDVNAAVDITVTAVIAPETTATATTDYSLSTPSVTLASGTGNRSGSIVVTIPTTAVFSGAEVIVLNMTATNAIFSNNTNQQTVTITINDYPIVSMHEPPRSVTQGHSFGFELRASPQPLTSAIAVNLEFNDGSNGIITAITGATEDTTYTDGYAGEVMIPIEGTLQVMVDTQNPKIPSGDQDVTVTLAAGSNYNVSETAEENSRTIKLKDNEIASEMRPRLSIAADSTALVRADLNENAEFIITASHQTTDTIMVSVEVKEPGDFVTDGVLTPAPTLSTASPTTTIRVPTSDPRTGTNDPNSVITVTLIDGDNYTISTEAGEHTATRTVTDDPPVVSFDGGVPEWLTQGNPLKFTLKIEPPQSTPTRVPLTINNGANPFLGAVTPASQYNSGMLIIPPSGSQAFEIASSNQSVGRTNVSIEIRPENNATYTIASDSTGPQTISLGNHLSPTPTDPRFKFTDQIAGPIYVPHAGATVTFKIEKTALSESRTLRVMLSSADGNFITNPIQSMTLPPGIEEVFDFPVVLTDNDLNNRTGATTLTAQLLDGANYTVATSSDNTRTVTVTDIPRSPEVSISTDYTEVTPGKKIPFTLELSEEPVGNLSINLTASDSDTTNTDLSIGPITVTAGQTLVSSEFTAPSGTAADLGTLTISVATGDDYVVATGDDGRIVVRFETQTTIPELSIAGPTSSEIEGGENLIFTITANNSTEVDLAIPVEIADHRSQNNANFVDEATYYVRLESGTTLATLPVSTNPDTTDEDDGVC